MTNFYNLVKNFENKMPGLTAMEVCDFGPEFYLIIAFGTGDRIGMADYIVSKNTEDIVSPFVPSHDFREYEYAKNHVLWQRE